MLKQTLKAILLISLSSMLLISRLNAASLDEIKKRDVIKIAVFSDKPPFGHIDANGKSQGYDVALAHQIAKDLLGDENKVEFVLVEAQHRIDVLKSNKADITLANFTVTPDRAEQVDFAKPYMKTAVAIVSPKKAELKDTKQLTDKTIAVNKGTTGETLLIKDFPKTKLLKYDSNTETFAALFDGRADGLVHDNTLLYAWVKQNPNFVVSINQIGDIDYIAPAVKKGNKELLAWLNQEITDLQAKKFFHKAYDTTIKPFYGAGIDASNIVIESK